jgi:NAD(P)-dependent dehydrogenase (short-subunit alcohol dehydrogenase family)
VILSNKKIIVVGGTSGIGWIAVQKFIDEGAQVLSIGKQENESSNESIEGLTTLYADARKEEIELDGNALSLAQLIIQNKTYIRKAEAEIDTAEKDIKMLLGTAERGKAGSFHISWPMRSYKASPEKITPAKEAYSIRQSSLSIKEWT